MNNNFPVMTVDMSLDILNAFWERQRQPQLRTAMAEATLQTQVYHAVLAPWHVSPGTIVKSIADQEGDFPLGKTERLV